MNLANRLHSFRVGSDLGSSDRSMPDFSGTLGASMRPGRRRWSEHDLKHGLLVQLRRRSTGRDSRRRYGLELVGLFPFIRFTATGMSTPVMPVQISGARERPWYGRNLNMVQGEPDSQILASGCSSCTSCSSCGDCSSCVSCGACHRPTLPPLQ